MLKPSIEGFSDTRIMAKKKHNQDKKSFGLSGPYSLHTEYSYGPRKLNSPILKRLPVLKNSIRSRHSFVNRQLITKNWLKIMDQKTLKSLKTLMASFPHSLN